MIPFILAAIGGGLIANALSNDVNKYAKGGMIAPNGKPSNLTPEQYKLVRTPAFKAWFGDFENDPKNASKVVDENGEPLVVYHGTNNKFNVFNRSIETNYRGKSELIIENEDVDSDEFKKIIDYNDERGGMSVFDEFWFSNINWMPKSKYVLPCFINSKTLYVEENGQGGQGAYNSYYGDGVKITNADGQQGVDYYVVKKSNQIKLADGTNTKFDSSNKDIRYSEGGVIVNKEGVSTDARKGGIFKGKRHSEGGIAVDVKGGSPVEVETDEALIVNNEANSNKTVTLDGKKMTPREVLSTINQSYGGVPIKKQGGTLDTEEMVNKVNSDKEPVVVEGGSIVITRNAILDDKTKHEFNGKSMTNKEILSEVNKMNGGVAFSKGGKV